MQFSGLQYRRWQQASLVGLLITILTGCQRPESGQQPGMFQLPMEYLYLMQTPLPAQLPVPVQGVKPQQIADTWGAARSQGRSHEGVDIFAKRGTPVLSTTEGMVMSVGINTLGGNVVWVLGPDMSRHYYAHLESYGQFKKGDWIKAGDVIGYVGNSGNARTTPPHLHYGIYRNAEGAINPYPYLSRK
ncbi:peptidase M23 [Alkanindiges hydrocarboniclasticus]|uniref:Peptidase M23 n=1 Tax=Alkanindiges hydrocarboniclasticus TaxID=1907941 RepID=A0A1S8CV02_9GAMM|nr:M23 family metallopeptidase [Alkanindiges hydrocarboniclasticus]ONG41067.1 peptidase M23 [Alkanindiges hydrocarboniclasticus]